MERFFFVSAAALGFLGVMLGAFGAHALKTRLAPDLFAIFEVGIRYHFYHVFALFIAAWAVTRWNANFAATAGWFFLAGIVIFSGSLYALALSGIRVLGAITPIGGLAFLCGWACLAMSALK